MNEADAINKGFATLTNGITPNGGVKTMAYYFDATGKPCKEEQAITMQILEYDAAGVCVFSLIADCKSDEQTK